MRLKAFKSVLLTFLIGAGLCSFQAKAMEPTDCTSEKYLIDHGHSPEIVRMINLQKERTEGNINNTKRSKSQNKFMKVLKNLWYEEDLTLPINDFGYNNITTVETDKAFGQKIIDTKNTVIDAGIKVKDTTQKAADYIRKDKNKKTDSEELNINNIIIRESN